MRSSSPSILTLGAAPLAEQDPIAGLEIEGNELAAFVPGAGANGDNFALLRLLFGGVRDDDAALRLLFAFDATDERRGHAGGRNFMNVSSSKSPARGADS